MCMVVMSAYMFVLAVPVEVRRGQQILWNWSYREL